MGERPGSTPQPNRRLRRGWTLAAVALVAVAIVVAANACGSTRHKIVKVTSPKPVPTTSTAPSRSQTRSVAPASVGTTGSVTRRVSGGSLLRPGARASFTRFAAGLAGTVDVAVMSLASGSVVVLGADTPAHGWSTTKIPVLVALLRARGTAGLSPAEQHWAQLAVTESDNQSILNLFGDLETLKGGLGGASHYVQALLRQSGDGRTVVATAPPPPGAVTTFGQTEWTPGDSASFFRALADGCLLPPPQTNYVLGLMQHIIPSQSLGLGAVDFGVPVAFKDGWGPEGAGYLVRQSGIIDPGSNRGVAVSVIVRPPPGDNSFGVGTQILTETAHWLQRDIRLRPQLPTGCPAGRP